MINSQDRQILQLALPSIISNITVPLLGMIDVAIVGHMGSAVYIGAVAVGSMIFNLVYWLFGFLRMGASGMTAQALGRRDLTEVTMLLSRSLAIALGIAFLLIILQIPLKGLMFWLIGPTADVVPFASTYFDIVIWGAPASLSLFALSGWCIGMQNTRIPMMVSIMQNIANILVSLTLVYGLRMKIEGVALGTVIAQYIGFLMAVALTQRFYGRLRAYWKLKGSFVRQSIIKFFNINRDIFLRTLLLHLSGCPTRGCDPLCEHRTDTTLSALLLFHGWFCIRRRGPRRPILWRSQLRATASGAPSSLRMGVSHDYRLYLIIYHRRYEYCPYPDRRASCHRDSCRVYLVGMADPCGRCCSLHLGRTFHRLHSHPGHARLFSHCSPDIFQHLFAYSQPDG